MKETTEKPTPRERIINESPFLSGVIEDYCIEAEAISGLLSSRHPSYDDLCAFLADSVYFEKVTSYIPNLSVEGSGLCAYCILTNLAQGVVSNGHTIIRCLDERLMWICERPDWGLPTFYVTHYVPTYDILEGNTVKWVDRAKALIEWDDAGTESCTSAQCFHQLKGDDK